MQKTRILVADNDPDHLKLMGDFLRRRGYSVVSAKNVLQAKEALQTKSIDLALLDVRLTKDRDRRDISGLTLASLAPKVPKIIVSRYPSEITVRRALRPWRDGRAVAVDFISKKQKLAQIEAAIKEGVGKAIQEAKYNTFFGKLQKGSRTAWRRLWDQQAWRLISLALRSGLTSSASQNVCLDVFRELARVRQPPRLAKLPTTLANEAMRKIEKVASKSSGRQVNKSLAAVKKMNESPISIKLHEDIAEPVVNGTVSEARLIKQVRKAIADLPIREQKAIVMHLFDEDSPADIARKLGVTRTTVNRYLRAASARIEHQLAELE